MTFYPPQIDKRLKSLKYETRHSPANAVGTGVGFTCGSFVRIYLLIDTVTSKIENASFKTNGCGFAVAAAELLAGSLIGKNLIELHGLDGGELGKITVAELGEFPAGRDHCPGIALDALRAALADFRSLRLEEFRGEKALICTCFGISENAIERVIEENSGETIEDVSRLTRAGTGCGSCRMLVQEMLDNKAPVE